MYKILVVDDNQDWLNKISAFLKKSEFFVVSVSNEEQAFEAVGAESFDFAVIDLRLHGHEKEDRSGLSLALAIRILNDNVRFILITGLGYQNDIAVPLENYGLIDFIEKDENTYDLTLKALKNARSERKRPNFISKSEITQLSLSLALGQSLLLRSHGRLVRTSRTWTILRVKLQRYSRRAELARKDKKNLRFLVEGIGRDLWKEVFAEHQESQQFYFEARGKSKYLSLLFEVPRDFIQLPLEFMRSESPSEYLVLRHPLSRFIYDAIPKRETISPSFLTKTKLTKRRQLRILLIASNTDPNIAGVDVEVQKLYEFLNARMNIEVNRIPTEKATYDYVRSEIEKPEYDIIHYAGHGIFNDTSPEESYICFWEKQNKEGAIIKMKASEFGNRLENSEARLVYLSCCEGTKSGNATDLLVDDFLGIADAVVQAGVPTVLGFRWPVSDTGACKMAIEFYKSLLEHGRPEFALWQARRELAMYDRNDPVWLSPILIHQQ